MKNTPETSNVPVIRVTGPATAPIYSWTAPDGETTTIDAEQLAHRMARSIRQSAVRWPNYLSLVLVVAVVGLHFRFGDPMLTIGVGAWTAVALAWLFFWSQGRARLVLRYDLDDATLVHAADSIGKAGEALHHASSLWEILYATYSWDRKRNAGASELVERRKARCAPFKPAWLECNVDLWMIASNNDMVVFLPECMLVRTPGRVVTAPYSKVSCDCEPTSFVEEESVPCDAEIIGTTWQYVNKSGGPDRRFNDNRELPRVLYGGLTLSVEGEPPLEFHVSSLKLANTAEMAFAAILSSADGESMDSDAPAQAKLSDSVGVWTSAEVVRYADTVPDLDSGELWDALERDFNSVTVDEGAVSLIEPLVAMRDLEEEFAACLDRTLREYAPEDRDEMRERLEPVAENMRAHPEAFLKAALSHAYEESEQAGPQQASWELLANEIEQIRNDPSRLRRFDETRVLEAVKATFGLGGADPAAGSQPPSAVG